MGGVGLESTSGVAIRQRWVCILHTLLIVAELGFQLAPKPTSLVMTFHLSEGGERCTRLPDANPRTL